jgi:PPK2 family polyphosphate:nucleotide phosphotransferase
MNFTDKLIVEPGAKVKLDKFDPADTFGFKDNDKTQGKIAKTIKRLDDLQYLLYAEGKRALLVVLQAMDAGGKDGTIRHVMSGVNPQGCRVTSFKVPSEEELRHDFLWRSHLAVPEKGMIGIFNRSHYEDVLVVRVHRLVPKQIWKNRFQEINEFEKLLAENRVKILKFYLHISKQEQKRRFEERNDDPKKNWKLSPADLAERQFWSDYMEAYEDVLSRCSTGYAPWFVIPADHKWFRNLAVSSIIVETLEGMDMQFPRPTISPKKLESFKK